MTDAPEKMVLQPCPMYGWDHPDRVIYAIGHARSYTRTDIHEAEKRAAYQRGLEDAAKVAESKYETLPSNCMCKYGRKKGESCAEWTSRNAAVSIRALAKEKRK